MPCDQMPLNNTQRMMREKALEELAEDIKTGRRVISRNMLTGEVSVSKWGSSTAATTGLCEGCALRTIESRGWATKSLATQGITKKPFVLAGHNDHDH